MVFGFGGELSLLAVNQLIEFDGVRSDCEVGNEEQYF